jgi:hypothetical protein
MKNIDYDDKLLFTCAFIEYIARITHNKRNYVVNTLQKEGLEVIYKQARELNRIDIKEIAEKFIYLYSIEAGNFDNTANNQYNIPTHKDMGRVYMRLIVMLKGNVIDKLLEVYDSWMADKLDNYNIAVYFMSPEYIYECYESGEILH